MKDDSIAVGRHGLPALADCVALYSWDMVANNFCGDAEMARLFALDEADLKAGVAVELLIDCLHVDDRERIAKALHTAIVCGTLSRESYRVHAGKGQYRRVLSVLRCFNYSDGLPTTCSGFACEVPSVASKPTPTPVAHEHSNVVQLRSFR